MSPNILITGAAGYIGGSLLSEFISSFTSTKKANLFAAARTEEQTTSLSKLPVNALQLDLNDEKAIVEAVLRNEIDILINAVASFRPSMVQNMVKALGQRRRATGRPVYFIHSGVINVFSVEAGWPYGEIKDSGPVFEKEKQWGVQHPVRETDVLVVEESHAQGVTCMNVVVPNVYGRGTGEGRKLSVSIPAYVRTSVADKMVHKFDKNTTPPGAHISDLAALYVVLVEKILRNESIPNGKNGYYFAVAHGIPWWAVMDCIAKSLHARGLVTQPQAELWPSDKTAAERLGFPVEHIRSMGAASVRAVAANAFQAGWSPKWDQERFLESIDDEVQAVMDLDTVRASIFDTLNAAKG